MKKIANDQEAMNLIEFLNHGGPDSEEEWSKSWDILENYQPGIAEVILSSENLIDPDEVLRIARERNKPIIL